MTWNDVGPIPPHSTKKLGIQITIVSAQTNVGKMIDHVKVTADCATGTGEADTVVNLTGEVTVTLPDIVPGETPPLPKTGGRDMPLFLAIGAMAAFVVTQSLRRRAVSRTVRR